MGREIYNLNVQSDSIRDKVFNFFFKGFWLHFLLFWLHVLLFYMCVCIYGLYYPMIQLLINDYGNIFRYRTYPYRLIFADVLVYIFAH